jgi:predicted protein tyrosine phosphatase
MIKELCKNVSVGNLDDLKFVDKSKYAIIHATKSSWLSNKNDVIFEKGDELFVNWVDAKDQKYFDYKGEGVSVFIKILDFIDKWAAIKKVFVHCDEGKSRSPSIIMVYMAKRLKLINNKDHVFAEREFTNLYPEYFANKGISDFLFKNWFKIK